jgi:hypothetical protein
MLVGSRIRRMLASDVEASITVSDGGEVYEICFLECQRSTRQYQ